MLVDKHSRRARKKKLQLEIKLRRRLISSGFNNFHFESRDAHTVLLVVIGMCKLSNNWYIFCDIMSRTDSFLPVAARVQFGSRKTQGEMLPCSPWHRPDPLRDILDS